MSSSNGEYSRKVSEPVKSQLDSDTERTLKSLLTSTHAENEVQGAELVGQCIEKNVEQSMSPVGTPESTRNSNDCGDDPGTAPLHDWLWLWHKTSLSQGMSLRGSPCTHHMSSLFHNNMLVIAGPCQVLDLVRNHIEVTLESPWLPHLVALLEAPSILAKAAAALAVAALAATPRGRQLVSQASCW